MAVDQLSVPFVIDAASTGRPKIEFFRGIDPGIPGTGTTDVCLFCNQLISMQVPGTAE
jgi:hypothetical protein